MITSIKDVIVKARKEYPCDACQFVLDGGHLDYMTFTEKRIMAIARKKYFRIYPGEKYMYQYNVDSGDRWVFRAIPEVHKICVKYDLYPDY